MPDPDWITQSRLEFQQRESSEVSSPYEHLCAIPLLDLADPAVTTWLPLPSIGHMFRLQSKKLGTAKHRYIEYRGRPAFAALYNALSETDRPRLVLRDAAGAGKAHLLDAFVAMLMKQGHERKAGQCVVGVVTPKDVDVKVHQQVQPWQKKPA